jgi:hypothetical protein
VLLLFSGLGWSQHAQQLHIERQGRELGDEQIIAGFWYPVAESTGSVVAPRPAFVLSFCMKCVGGVYVMIEIFSYNEF